MNFRKYFITGLIVILPLWITVVVFRIIFKWISGFTKPFLEPILELIFAKEPRVFLLSISSFLLTLFVIYLVGILASNIVSRRILFRIENLLVQIPLLREVYSSARKLVQFVFTKQQKYKRTVLIEYPRKGIYAIGFLTSEQKIESGGKSIVTVFVPTTPNPTSGYMVILPEEDIKLLDINVDDAIKMIISGGIISSEKIKEFIVQEK